MLPFTEGIDLDISKGFPAAVQELAFRGQTLKLDLVVIIHLFPNTLDFDAWVETEDTTHTVFPMQEHLEYEYKIHPGANMISCPS